MNPHEQNYWQGDEAANIVAPSASEQAPSPVAPEVITWQASEYIHHQKSFTWYLVCSAIGVVLTFITFLVLRSVTFSALIVVITIALVVYAQRPPRTLSYVLSASSLTIDQTNYSFLDFRSFGVIEDGPLYSVVLIPVKRFMPSVNIYFPPEYGEQIVDHFGSSLPMEHFEPDFLDQFVKKIRF